MAKKSDTAVAREAAMIAAYQSGKKVTVIEQEFEVGRSTLYHILRRAGVMPSRSRKNLDAGSRDTIVAGLRELIAHQDKLLAEQEAELSRYRKAPAKPTRSRRPSA